MERHKVLQLDWSGVEVKTHSAIKLVREERGFTLVEMLVTIVVMIVVLFAIYNIFDASIRVFRFGNDKVEAVENARIGLEKMEREIRAAYPYDVSSSTPKKHLFFNAATPATPAMPSSTQITFGNELGSGNRTVDSPAEVITYRQNGNELVRTQNGATQPVVAPVAASGLQFSYFKADGTTAVTATEGEGYIEVVRISLTINVDGRQQILATDVRLRNREI